MSKNVTPERAWHLFTQMSGFSHVRKNLPMDRQQVSSAFRADATIDIWKETHMGATILSYKELMENPDLPDGTHGCIRKWLDVYDHSPFPDPPTSRSDLVIYHIPEHPFLVNIKGTNFWILIAPTTTIPPNQRKRRKQ